MLSGWTVPAHEVQTDARWSIQVTWLAAAVSPDASGASLASGKPCKLGMPAGTAHWPWAVRLEAPLLKSSSSTNAPSTCTATGPCSAIHAHITWSALVSDVQGPLHPIAGSTHLPEQPAGSGSLLCHPCSPLSKWQRTRRDSCCAWLGSLRRLLSRSIRRATMTSSSSNARATICET